MRRDRWDRKVQLVRQARGDHKARWDRKVQLVQWDRRDRKVQLVQWDHKAPALSLA